MAVFISDSCISCNACLIECPTQSITDNENHPDSKNIYFVIYDTCTECIGFHEQPICAEECPTNGCIIWGENVKTEGKIPGQPVFED